MEWLFSKEAFWYTKFYESEAKHDNRNVKKDLSVIFEIKYL